MIDIQKVKDILNLISNQNISIDELIEKIPKNIFTKNITNESIDRTNMYKVAKYMLDIHQYQIFAIPYIDWIEKWIELEDLKDKKILEIMCGRGLIAAILKKYNIKITAIDNKRAYYPANEEIIIADCIEYIKKYANEYNTLFCTWPPYSSNIFTKACKLYLKTNPQGNIYYIGETKGGCTADDSFFNMFELTHIECGYYPLPTLYDNMYKVKKKKHNSHI